MQTVEKWVTRSDAWTPDDDERLASIVLHHIRTGSTQLRAFEDAANELGRTAAACGYRWNGVLRKDKKMDIEAAKVERKSAQKSHSTARSVMSTESSAAPITSSESMKDVIRFLQTFDEQYQRIRKYVISLEEDKKQLQNRVRDLESESIRFSEPDHAPVTPQQLAEDSKTLFAIMERARKLLQSDSGKATAE